MTIQEIRDLIAKKIAGQGTQVDVGGGLAAILNGILDVLNTLTNGEIKEDLSHGAVEISQQDFNKYIELPIVSYDGLRYILSSTMTADIEQAAEAMRLVDLFIYYNNLLLDDTGQIVGYSAIVISHTFDDEYYIQAFEL